uniref:Uncharacterized protein n=1 Tax=Anguilla anguilla TaxID=7936 RepID=A0A0E9TRV8_ANGAN
MLKSFHYDIWGYNYISINQLNLI